MKILPSFSAASLLAKTVTSCLAMSFILAGCGSAPTHYYSLAPVPGQVAAPVSLTGGRPVHVIEVLKPSVVTSLDRDMIVSGSRNYRLRIESGAAWSEPLAEMVGHMLAANLAQRLPSTVVFSQNDSVAAAPQVEVELSLTRFEIDNAGYGVIEGVLSVHQADTPREQAVSVPVHWVSSVPVQGGMAGFANMLSQGVGILADKAIILMRQGL